MCSSLNNMQNNQAVFVQIIFNIIRIQVPATISADMSLD